MNNSITDENIISEKNMPHYRNIENRNNLSNCQLHLAKEHGHKWLHGMGCVSSHKYYG